MAENNATDPDFSTTLARGLSVILAFDAEHPDMTQSEVAERTSLSRSAARRFLITLERMGYVESHGRRFRLSPRTLELGYAYLSSLSIAELALPHLKWVAQQTNESCSMCVLSGAEVVYVARIPAQRIMSVSLHVGTRLPAIATSMGRVLIAALPKAERDAFLDSVALVHYTPKTVTDKAQMASILDTVAQVGYAIIDEELEMGLRSIAVPLRDRRSAVVAAFNVSTFAGRTSVDDMIRKFLPLLQKAAAAIQQTL